MLRHRQLSFIEHLSPHYRRHLTFLVPHPRLVRALQHLDLSKLTGLEQLRLACFVPLGQMFHRKLGSSVARLHGFRFAPAGSEVQRGHALRRLFLMKLMLRVLPQLELCGREVVHREYAVVRVKRGVEFGFFRVARRVTGIIDDVSGRAVKGFTIVGHVQS